MASGVERPDLEALKELDEVLRHLEAELASWRRRALSAEARLGESGGSPAEAGPRSKELEDENRALHQRLTHAKGRVGDLLDRLRFLEEQQQVNGGNGQ